jgi:predicted cupin superfamily sugar epimerase
MDKLIYWMNEHNVEISWFLIGCMVQSAFVDFSKGDFFDALICIAIAVLNYLLVKRKI